MSGVHSIKHIDSFFTAAHLPDYYPVRSHTKRRFDKISDGNSSLALNICCDSCESLTERVLHQADVFITPGFIFGTSGNRYIRLSLCANENQMEEALRRIQKMQHQ